MISFNKEERGLGNWGALLKARFNCLVVMFRLISVSPALYALFYFLLLLLVSCSKYFPASQG